MARYENLNITRLNGVDAVLSGALSVTGAITQGATGKTSVGVGAANGTGVAATEYGNGVIHKTVLTLTDHAISLTDETSTIAYGGSKIYDLPEGAVLMLGALSDLAVTKSSAGVDDDWDGDFALGTAAADNDATLDGTEDDILPSTATPQASSGATTANGQSTGSEIAVHDGTSSADDVYLNVLVDDTDHNVDGTACDLIFNGTITLYWINLGNY